MLSPARSVMGTLGKTQSENRGMMIVYSRKMQDIKSCQSKMKNALSFVNELFI